VRLCIFSPDRPDQSVNGPLRTAEETAGALARLGHEVHLIGYAAGGPRVYCADGVWRHEVEIADRSLPALRDCPAAMDLYAAAAKHAEVLTVKDAAPVDLVVSALWPGEGLVCLLDERLSAATVLVTPVKLMLDRGMLSGQYFEAMARIERAVVSGSKHVHHTSGAITADVEATFGLSLPQSGIVPLFVADRTAGPGQERYGEREDVEVLFVGRAEPRKGADVLLAAARILASECPTARYIFVGPGQGDALRAEVDASQALHDRVFLIGAVDEARLWRLYAGSDVVCVPSRYESFGYTLVEAMMFGKPLVAGSAGGIAETVRDGENALLCPPGDEEALARTLARLIRDPQLRARYGRRSRELYEERYSDRPGGERTAALYASMAASDRQRARSSGRLIERLADAVAEVARLDRAVARQTAAELLDGTSYAGEAEEEMAPARQWRARALEAERQNAELRTTLDRIECSNSWRLTKPLRDLRARARRGRNGSR
jgi:glycosyltransferase involved in cell wall biosynthesis